MSMPVNTTTKPVKPATTPAPGAKTAFEKPRLRRLGQLPRVTTAFGGSFTP